MELFHCAVNVGELRDDETMNGDQVEVDETIVNESVMVEMLLLSQPDQGPGTSQTWLGAMTGPPLSLQPVWLCNAAVKESFKLKKLCQYQPGL